MSFIIRNISGGQVDIGDLGISLAIGEDYSLSSDRPQDVATSIDLPANITAGNIVVLDPLDGVTLLSTADSIEAIAAHNDTHYRIRGGRAVDVSFDNAGTDNAGTDLQDAVVNNSGKVQWLNEWQQQTYEKHDMVIDGDWTMIANAQTTERAAPQADGPLVITPPTATTWTTANDISVVKMVHKYTTSVSGWGITLRVRTAFWDIDVVTRITFYNVTTGDIKILNNPILNDDEWTLLVVSSGLIPSGTNFEIWYEYYNSSDSNSIEGGWTSSVGTGVPADKSFTIDSLSAPTQIRFDYDDLDSTDRQTELDGVTVGSIIHISETGDISRSSETEVTAVDTTDPTSVKYSVSLIHNGPKNIRTARTCTVRIDVPVTAPSVYNVNTDYWVANQPTWATVSSELYYDSVQQADVNDAYGIEVSFQKAYISPDWDYVSSSDSSGAAGGETGTGEANTASNLGGGSGTFAQKSGIDLEFKSLTAGTGITITPSATEIQITNSLPNADQNLWATISSDSGSTTADAVADNLLIAGGTGISTGVTGDTLTITNDSPNVDQNIWETITADTGSASANTTTDSFDIGGTTDQIATTITGDALAIALAANTVIPGTEGIDIPSGTTAERPVTPTTGVMRFNTTLGLYEAWDGTQWVTFGATPGNGVTEILSGQLAHISGTTTTPYDNTPPLITEGTQFFTQDVTTQTDAGRIVIWFSTITTVSNANRTLTIALYRDTTLIGVTAVSAPNTNGPVTTTFIVVDSPGAAGTYTYTGRIGTSASATWYIGGFTTNANYGGAANTNNQYVLMRIE